MRDRITTALEVVGFVVASVGFGLAWVPLGLIVFGAGLVAGAWWVSQ